MDDIENYIDQFERGVCLSKFYNKTTHEVVTINDTSFKYPSIEHGSINPSQCTIIFGISFIVIII